MPVAFREVVKIFDIGPIQTDDEPVELRVEVLREPGSAPAFSARVWRRAAILLHPTDSTDEGELSEFRILVEDEAFADESFRGESIEAVTRQIRHRIEAVYYIPR